MQGVETSLCLCGRVAGQERSWLLDRPVLDIGRSARSAIHIPDPTVSKEHATVRVSGDACLIEDLGSRNGTRVNGVPVRAPMRLKAGDEIVIGHVVFNLIAESDPGHTRRPNPANSSMMVSAREILGRSAGDRDPLGAVRTLAAAGRLLVTPRSARETCEAFLSIVVQALPASRLVLMLRPETGGDPIPVAARPAGGAAPVLSRAILDAVLQDSVAVLAVDAEQDPRFRGHESILAHSVHSVIAVPLLDDDTVLGLLYADSADPTVVYEPRHLEIMTVLANMAAVKIANSQLLEHEERRALMLQELATARRIQRGILPQTHPAPPGWECWAFLDTCHEVGGDLYDLWQSPSGALYFMVGDVSGKGMGAALLMTSVVGSSRMLYDDEPEPDELARRLNRTLHRSTDASHFVTGFIGRLEPDSGRLRYVNAGHLRPYVMSGGALSELQGSSLPLGVSERTRYPIAETVLPAGAVMMVHTDGIPEAYDGARFFGNAAIERRLIESDGQPCETVARSILDDLGAFLGPDRAREDDVTLLLLRREERGQQESSIAKREARS